MDQIYATFKHFPTILQQLNIFILYFPLTWQKTGIARMDISQLHKVFLKYSTFLSRIYCVLFFVRCLSLTVRRRNLFMFVFLVQTYKENLHHYAYAQCKNLVQKQLDTARYHFMLTLKYNIHKKSRFLPFSIGLQHTAEDDNYPR